MRDKILAALAVLGLLGSLAASATPAERCDRDGCWTYDCNADSTHCHRHWIRVTTRTGAAPTGGPSIQDTAHPDQVCDSNGDNCHAPPPPN